MNEKTFFLIRNKFPHLWEQSYVLLRNSARVPLCVCGFDDYRSTNFPAAALRSAQKGGDWRWKFMRIKTKWVVGMKKPHCSLNIINLITVWSSNWIRDIADGEEEMCKRSIEQWHLQFSGTQSKVMIPNRIQFHCFENYFRSDWNCKFRK